MKWQDWITSTYNKDNIDFEEIPSEYIKALRLEEMNTMYLGSKEKTKISLISFINKLLSNKK